METNSTTIRYSVNPKCNAIPNAIREELLTISDTLDDSLMNIKRYMREYPNEIDYNIVQHGNLTCYTSQVYEMYKTAGYKCEGWSTDKIWEAYRRQTGWVARQLMREFGIKIYR